MDLFKEVTQFWIDNYLCKPNYQRIDGKCFFGLCKVKRLIKDFGGHEGCAAALDDFREGVRKAGYEIYFAGAN